MREQYDDTLWNSIVHILDEWIYREQIVYTPNIGLRYLLRALQDIMTAGEYNTNVYYPCVGIPELNLLEFVYLYALIKAAYNKYLARTPTLGQFKELYDGFCRKRSFCDD